jgi:murein DD-endopeptidase MepM/ murein hydrolase activator NlpD
MIKAIIFTFSSLLLLSNAARAQYVNADSLVFFEGFETPLLISELDSLEIYSPDILPENFHQGSLTSGYLLSLFSLPGKGNIISRFGPRSGRMHTGTDIKMDKGDTICAAFDGIVTRSKYYHGYGNMIVLDHGNKLETYYAHLSGYLVKTGDFVKTGEPIGLAGSTGRATCNHLHFEIREDDKPYDSELVFDYESGKTSDKVAQMDNLAELHKELKPKGYSVNKPVSQKYVVRPGDSLYKISHHAKTTIKSLCMLNDLKETSVLQIGQVLTVY